MTCLRPLTLTLEKPGALSPVPPWPLSLEPFLLPTSFAKLGSGGYVTSFFFCGGRGEGERRESDWGLTVVIQSFPVWKAFVTGVYHFLFPQI